jgi:DNA-binding GntR family transcriptional regulator
MIRLCAAAARVACLRMTPRYLKALHDSVEQARRMPSRFAWDRKVAAHAEIYNLPADVAADPVLAVPLRDARGHFYDLIVTVGPAADGIILSSRHRLLALMRAGDADGVAREMKQHIGACSGCGACPGAQHGAAASLSPPDPADLEPAKFPPVDTRQRP